jgi:hypothetical protein
VNPRRNVTASIAGGRARFFAAMKRGTYAGRQQSLESLPPMEREILLRRFEGYTRKVRPAQLGGKSSTATS